MKSNTKLTLDHAHEIAKNKKGKCSSVKYVNVDSKLQWECELGHKWESSLYNVRKLGTWCHYCVGFARLDLGEMQQLAKKSKGKCLSTVYINSDTKLTWECEFEHQWEASPNSIKNTNSWCPECSGKKKLTIEKMQEIAKDRGGKCLSIQYVNNKTKLHWECEKGHNWHSSPTSVITGKTWCPVCAANIKATLELMRELAKSRNGQCLSSEYVNARAKLTWKCERGHEWDALPNDIKQGKWCPTCFKSKRKGESAVRNFFEKIFYKKFPSLRPLWLMFEGRRLELDGYCEELKIAFEYQGIYHFNEAAYWYSDKSMSFERRQLIDDYKRKTCAKNKVLLLEINELNPRNTPERWKDDIKDILISKGIEIPLKYDDVPFGAVEYHSSNSYIAKANEVANLRGGICHSKTILYKAQIVQWECKAGHTWSASLVQIISKNTWCPECAGRKKLSIHQMQELAKNRGGKCLSEEYVNAQTDLLWECDKGHTWYASPSSVKNNGTWCFTCRGSEKLTIEQMQGLAKLRNGKCLSVEYVNAQTNLLWECSAGHTWHASPSSIKNNDSWCPVCAGSRRLTIEQMQELAKMRGGKCLSIHYVNAKTKLHWECHKGHQWFATMDKIKYAERWCKECKSLNARKD